MTLPDAEGTIDLLVKVLPPISPGSIVVLRMHSANPTTGRQLEDAMRQHFGHGNFLVVVLGHDEDLAVIPSSEIASWLLDRHGYFGGVGDHYLEEHLD